ncbi:MAG: hypothetical protein H8E36_03915 [Rhodospirillaceae bacterium]|nr:hypothetical protein [Rhodospirillaceae bacterium]MBL6930045.1 hypothetical protein [Rhodospirillales bacterium]MBL6941964.1 hypothetical protein [Rhodospirillales bacterium]
MEEYAGLIKLGFVFALVLLVGLVLRLMGFGKKDKTGKGKSKKKGSEEKFFKQDAYVDHGGDGGEWEDSDMYAMKEGKKTSRGIFDDVVKEKKGSKKLESWEDY